MSEDAREVVQFSSGIPSRINVEVKEGVHWVGARDWVVRDFHGYLREKGTTYNACLVVDYKITLFDTLKKAFKGDLFHCIYKVVKPNRRVQGFYPVDGKR